MKPDSTGVGGYGKILIHAAEIQKRVGELAAAIDRDHRRGGVRFLVTLKGAWVFAADLVRAIRTEVRVDFVHASSYGDGTESSGHVRIVAPAELDLEGAHIVLVEELVDTGRTIRTLLDHCRASGAASIRVAALLNKPARRVVEVPIDYIGFDIPDEFVIGYGMDWAGDFRHLPDIRVLRTPPAN